MLQATDTQWNTCRAMKQSGIAMDEATCFIMLRLCYNQQQLEDQREGSSTSGSLGYPVSLSSLRLSFATFSLA